MNKYVIKYDKMAVIFLHRIAVQKTFARFTWKNFSVFHQESHSPIALNFSWKDILYRSFLWIFARFFNRFFIEHCDCLCNFKMNLKKLPQIDIFICGHVSFHWKTSQKTFPLKLKNLMKSYAENYTSQQNIFLLVIA